MHLQSLELFGFKSFADKTVFNFHEGITAIVGPNGCGKSNVLDAVRWVLGEQSAKSLRGGEMADVIFNGTDSRKPLGFAEVSLTLTDCATDLEVDWHDVRVTRRVYRDGNSEYFLNKTACRLRDIQSLFADTGVGRTAYSMMEQGRIDLILSSRPEDRRAVFEEAAGITKYKTQKREALRKLEATEANLLRIGDIIKEVKRQIGSLQRQAGKARRYQALLSDLQVLDTHHSRKQLEVLERELAACRTEIERLTQSERETRAKIDKGEAELGEERQALDKIDIEIAEGRAEAQRLQSEIAAHRSRIELNRQRAQELAELIERARSEITSAEAKHSKQATAIHEADALIKKTNELLQNKEAELKKLTDDASHLRSERTARESELQELQLALTTNEGRVAALEDELSGITIRREATKEHLVALDARISEARADQAKIQKTIKTAQAASEGERKSVDLLLAETRDTERKLEQYRQLLAEVEKNFATLERALTEKESRLDVLKQLNEEGQGLAHGSQAVLQGLGDPKRFQSAVDGALVSQLDVDPKFVAAIEAALGRNLHTVILSDADKAGEIIAALSAKKLGRAALLIPELSESIEEPGKKSLPEGALGWAVEKVHAPKPLQSLVARLLDNVVVFADLDQALRFKKTSPQYAAVTLAGEFISIAGILFGGAGTQKESLLGRKSRISTLTSEFSVLSGQRAALDKKRAEAKANSEQATQDLEKARARHQTADLAQSTSRNQIVLFEKEIQEAARKIESMLAERSTLAQQLEAADGRTAQLEAELETVRERFVAQQTRQSAAKTAQQKAASTEEQTSEKLTELRLAVATERQRHENIAAQRQPMAARETELAELIAARRADIETFENRLKMQARESTEAEAAIKTQTAQHAEAEAGVEKIAKQRASRLAAINDGEAGLRAVRNSLNELHDHRGQQQVRESQLQMKIDNLAEHITRRYQVDLRSFTPDEAGFEKTLRVQLKRAEKEPAPKADVDVAEIEKIIADLTRLLDNMGPVNLEAVQEYDELEERHRFLETQNNDLTAARRELLDVIARINSTTQKLFAETFAQVRTNFREMFAELFGGGRADLSLMDESDPLNCGIEISAKPPGKQLQSVTLLSGGERTMTAVALLFAIYMVRPSPFCVLDELDAPLDESNINRFIRVLERFVAQSQFIIITHNKRTIAKADVLYGVTMEERGVSKLVGMKLTGRPETANEPAPDAHAGNGTQRHFPLEENGHAERKQSFAAR